MKWCEERGETGTSDLPPAAAAAAAAGATADVTARGGARRLRVSVRAHATDIKVGTKPRYRHTWALLVLLLFVYSGASIEI